MISCPSRGARARGAATVRAVMPRDAGRAVARTAPARLSQPRVSQPPMVSRIGGHARIGLCRSTFYDPPDRFVAGAVGQPGERIFYLQATASGRVTSVALEKFQVSLLAERIDELLDEVLRRTGGSPRYPPPRPPRWRTTRRSTCPCWRTSGSARSRWPGTATAAWSSSRRRRNRTTRSSRWPTRSPPTGRACCGCGSRRGRACLRPACRQIVAAGRPPCPLCGLPLDTDGHICPRQNGHRLSHA